MLEDLQVARNTIEVHWTLQQMLDLMFYRFCS